MDPFPFPHFFFYSTPTFSFISIQSSTPNLFQFPLASLWQLTLIHVVTLASSWLVAPSWAPRYYATKIVRFDFSSGIPHHLLLILCTSGIQSCGFMVVCICTIPFPAGCDAIPSISCKALRHSSLLLYFPFRGKIIYRKNGRTKSITDKEQIK